MTADAKRYTEGTRLRFTVEGVVDSDGDLVVAVEGTVGRYIYRSILENAGTVEVLVDPIPEWSEHEGAVVLDKDGDVWQLKVGGDWYMAGGSGFYESYVDLEKRVGPLTLIYDPATPIEEYVDAVVGERVVRSGELKVGDRWPFRLPKDEDSCQAVFNGSQIWNCNRRKDHFGDHVATDGVTVVMMWPRT